MYVLVSYDVSTSDAAGPGRLRRVSKVCLKYGQRVQNSVFECMVDPAQYESLKFELTTIIDTSSDSLRLYNLGKHWRSRVEHFGCRRPYDPEAPLII